MSDRTDSNRVQLLVSACLLGEKVRYDGQHKYDPFLVEQLGPFVEWRRICPESDCGMPTPRPSMHLVGDPQAPRLISRTGVDMTEQMRRFTEEQLLKLDAAELCGYVCKKDSPSSGMTRVKVYNERVAVERVGSGLFTAAFMARFPLVPVEEEGRLHDARLRESFVERVFCRRRWLDLIQGGKQRRRLIDFHTDHKFLLLAHGRSGYAELLETIDAYRDVLLPLIVPLTLIKHYVRKYKVGYLARQVYLAPYPAELMLRNHI